MQSTIRREVEIDTEISERYSDWLKAASNLDSARDSVHHASRDMGHAVTRTRREWNLTLEQCLNADMSAKGEYAVKHHAEAIAKYQAARRAAIDAQDAYKTAEAKYEGWSRFFRVTNVNGHIHSSLHCSTCYATTQYVWNPSLSGLTEEAAVEELGPHLCSVCFPSAPTEWCQNHEPKTKRASRPRRQVGYRF